MSKRSAVLITGAATGIGRAIAEQFVAQGWFVGLADINQSAVSSLAEQFGAERSMALGLDVCDIQQWNAALERFVHTAGQLNLLINNAGVLTSGDFAQISLSKHYQMLDVNIKGVVNGCYAAQPYLQQTPRAQVINLASASAIYGQPALATYSATKFAVRGLTEALNLEWEMLDIRVMDVMPLFVQTDMIQGMQAQAIQTLGVKLSAADVATVVWKAAHAPRWSKRVHWTVGLDSRVFYSLVGLMPDWISRSTTRWIASTH